jgi:hypothetical protein
MTELHLRGLEPTPEPVGMGSYNMDSHNVQRYVDADGCARNEGDIQVNPGGPYPISYRALIPKSQQCENMLVPICLSSTHIAYGSIRMEPVFMILGQSAATAAALALDQDVSVQEVPYSVLRQRLLADKQVLDLPNSTQHTPNQVLRSVDLEGVVVDDNQAELTGDWLVSRAISPFVDFGYRHDNNERQGSKSAVFRADLAPGRYDVRIAYSASGNRADNVSVCVRHEDGVSVVTVNQRRPPEHDNLFTSVGQYNFGAESTVVISTRNASGHVIIDAVQFLPIR